MGLFDWFRRKPKPEVPTAQSKAAPPSQPGVMFASIEDALKLADALRQQEAEERPLVYVFQHITLREAVFQNHPELVRDLTSGEPAFRPLRHFVFKARMRCEMVMALPPLPDDNGEAEGAELDLFADIKIVPYDRDGYRISVIGMPAPVASSECYFVGVVHKEGEPLVPGTESPSTRYFTLEKALPPEDPMFCEWFRDGSRENYGGGRDADPEAFVEGIAEKLRVSPPA